ncbi:helix-turn-helix transcriptional regulator [Flavivirga jejuensis]|uniref:AraC family transcriptional regulator n=1 Tax=Flavivirga jejuensis TaxID=870487 RepID=A0ABT8WIT7_9FLAO|nr:AraC family transcriptional regulator [Flavivirga jejuensis]MDO5972983.1 AraC family transcriptional regulator [Flavivirga jejuensis]
MKKIPVRKITPYTESNFSENFWIKSLADILNGKPLIESLHRHAYYFMLALQKGKGKHNIDFKSFDIADYSLFFLRPGQVHQLQLDSKSKGYLINFSTDLYTTQNKSEKHFLQRASSQNFYQLEADSFNKLYSLLDYIFNEYMLKEEGYQEVIKANMIILLTQLVRHRSNALSTNGTLYMQERLEEFMGLLAEHIYTKKKVVQYADMMNLSQYQLNTITKTSLGITCSEMIKEHIILEAKRNLLATSNQINQIAFHLGYDDVSHFIRLFKTYTGYTPDMFRNNFK